MKLINKMKTEKINQSKINRVLASHDVLINALHNLIIESKKLKSKKLERVINDAQTALSIAGGAY